MARDTDAQIPYRNVGLGTPDSRFWDMNRYPCQKPPWGSLTAIDLDRGVFRWRSVLGVIDALVEKGIAPTGAPNIGGSIVTAGGLVFIGGPTTSVSGLSTKTRQGAMVYASPGQRTCDSDDLPRQKEREAVRRDRSRWR